MGDVKNSNPAVIQDPNAGDGNPASSAGTKPEIQGGQPANTDQQRVPIQALHEEREKRQALQAQTELLQSQLKEMQDTLVSLRGGTGVSQPGVPQQGVGNSNQQVEELWETDPRRAMQTELMMGLNWLDSVNAALDAQEDEVQKKHADFKDYRSQVRRYLRSLPTQERAKPGVVELAYYVVRGQKADDLWKQREAELLDKIKKGESVQGLTTGITSTPTQPEGPVKLNEEQLKAAAAMNISPEEYVKYMKR